jgi:hypothetical protein
MDPTTKLILEEIGRLGVKLVNEERTEIIITPDNLKRFWTKVGEFMSSSMSGVHYGHYKAAMKCNVSTKILAQQLTVVAQSNTTRQLEHQPTGYAGKNCWGMSS